MVIVMSPTRGTESRMSFHFRTGGIVSIVLQVQNVGAWGCGPGPGKRRQTLLCIGLWLS